MFVSHNMAAVQSLCDQVLWVDAGTTRELGDAETVSRHYLEAGVKDQGEQVWREEEDRPGNEQVRLRRICIRAANDYPSKEMSIRTPLVFEIELENFAAQSQLLVNLCLLNARYEAVFVSKSCSDPEWGQRWIAGYSKRPDPTVPPLINTHDGRLDVPFDLEGQPI